jgi:hypothetical protein
MDPRDFHRLAKELCAGAAGPAELRCAVGRAYYASFNVAAAALGAWGFPITRNASGHGEVLRYLGNCGDPDLIAVGHKLAMLRSRRNAADYDLSAADVESPKTVRALVDLAGRLIETVDECSAPPRRDAIKAALEAYRRAIAPPPPQQPPP